jgi:hypothetical protein
MFDSSAADRLAASLSRIGNIASHGRFSVKVDLSAGAT